MSGLGCSMRAALTRRWGQRTTARPQHVPHSTLSSAGPASCARMCSGSLNDWQLGWKLRTPPAWGLNPPVGLSRDTSRVHVHSALLDFLVSVCGRACRFGAYKSSSSSTVLEILGTGKSGTHADSREGPVVRSTVRIQHTARG